MAAFYVTTPIYYANDRPHIGTAYSTIAADVIARYHALRGEATHFVTGLDEHGLKLERRARELGQEPQAFVDTMAAPFREAWEQLGCQYDDFIRTTEPRHKERAQELWRRCLASGDIYEDEYEGHYCVGCEAYYTEKDLLEGGFCPQHKRPVEKLKERSFFFRLSAYAERLLQFYEEHPQFVRPAGRFNEVKSFVREGLRDISISRTTFKWGVPVPEHPEHVMYVWFDALTNYMSVLGAPPRDGESSPLFERFWPQQARDAERRVVHIVGKDILRFHAVYWPAFLMSAGLQPPTQVWAHGWLTVNGDKMSKSLGNFLPPGPIVDAVGKDVLRYYLMRDVAFGQDGDFSHDNLFARYHGDLGNGLGNLLNRMVSSIVKKSLDGVVPDVAEADLSDMDRALIASAQNAAERAGEFYERVQPNRALESIWELVSATNKYVDQQEPWKLAKDPAQLLRLKQVSYTVLESLRWLSLMLWPILPDKCNALRKQLGLGDATPATDRDQWPHAWGELPAGTQTTPGEPLFPRFDPKEQQSLIAQLRPQSSPPPAAEGADKAQDPQPLAEAEPFKDDIVFDDFAKLDLRVAQVLEAERVPKSKKLLRLKVDLGPLGERQILAGIGHKIAPETLVGQHLVIVANLPPRTMMGLQSEGMVLSASDGQTFSVLTPLCAMPAGSTVG